MKKIKIGEGFIKILKYLAKWAVVFLTLILIAKSCNKCLYVPESESNVVTDSLDQTIKSQSIVRKEFKQSNITSKYDCVIEEIIELNKQVLKEELSKKYPKEVVDNITNKSYNKVIPAYEMYLERIVKSFGKANINFIHADTCADPKKDFHKIILWKD